MWKEVVIKGKRCFNWQKCGDNKGSGCTRSSRIAKIKNLKEKCSVSDWGCMAVSCKLRIKDGICERNMFSNSCDESSIDEEEGWEIHILGLGKTLS